MSSPFGDLGATVPPPDAVDERDSRGRRTSGHADVRQVLEQMRQDGILGQRQRGQGYKTPAYERRSAFSLGIYIDQSTEAKDYGEASRVAHERLVRTIGDSLDKIEAGIERHENAANAAARRKRPLKSKHRRSVTGDRRLDRLTLSTSTDSALTIARMADDACKNVAQLHKFRQYHGGKLAEADYKTLAEFHHRHAGISTFLDSPKFYLPPRDVASLRACSDAQTMGFANARSRQYPPWGSATLCFSVPIPVPFMNHRRILKDRNQMSDYEFGLKTGILRSRVKPPRSIRERHRQMRNLTFEEAFFAREQLGLEAHVRALTVHFSMGSPESFAGTWVMLSDPDDPRTPPRYGLLDTEVRGSALESLYSRAVSCLAIDDRDLPTTEEARGAHQARQRTEAPEHLSSETGRESGEPTYESPEPTFEGDQDLLQIRVVRYSRRADRGHVVSRETGRKMPGHDRDPTIGIRYKRLERHGPLVAVRVPVSGAKVNGGAPKGKVIIREGLRIKPSEVAVPEQATTDEPDDEIALDETGRGPHSEHSEERSHHQRPGPRRSLVLETGQSQRSAREMEAPSLVTGRGTDQEVPTFGQQDDADSVIPPQSQPGIADSRQIGFER